MAVSKLDTVNTIVNRVAVEVGFNPVADVFGAQNTAFQQMLYLLTTVLDALALEFPWQSLVREFSYTTVGTEDGVIDLPDDFGYEIPATGWERSQSVPLAGPINAQEWAYLLGLNLGATTIYATIRFYNGQLYVLPNDPTPAGLNITFQYVSRNLVYRASTDEYFNDLTDCEAGDVVQLDSYLVTRFLKMAYLDAKGFDITKAYMDANRALNNLCGKDNGARILSARGPGRGDSYLLNGIRNVPDTGFGM